VRWIGGGCGGCSLLIVLEFEIDDEGSFAGILNVSREQPEDSNDGEADDIKDPDNDTILLLGLVARRLGQIV
jgi:hypothetical protein